MDVNAPVKMKDKSEIVDEPSLYRRWMTELHLAEKLYKPYWKECERILKKYTGQDTTGKQRDYERGKPRYNILWSNHQTLKPAIYSNVPNIVAKRRRGDKDAIARQASETVETCVKTNNDLVNISPTLSDCADDFLLFARCQAWARYVPTVEEVPVQVGDGVYTPLETVLEQRITSEVVEVDYLERDDWLCSPARKWREVRWVSKKAYLTREQLIEQFGQEVGREWALDYAPTDVDRDENPEAYEAFERACVWEIWDKETKTVLWVGKGLKDRVPKIEDDPLRLDGFFPCPEPAFGTVGQKLVPVPEYCIWGDMAKEIDRQTGQIAELTKGLRLVGVYNEQVPELARLLTEGRNAEMIPSKDWSGLMQGGGVAGAVQFLPLKEVTEALARLYDSRRQSIEAVYEISGKSDIMRGKTDPRETASAQNLKAGFSDLRLRDLRNEFQRFCRDLLAIEAEIIAEHFQPDTIAQMIGIENKKPEEQEAFPQVLALLKDNFRRNFAIDIETDSTIEVDREQEKASRIEAVDAIMNAIAKGVPIAQGAPEWAPFVAEAIGFVARAMASGRDFEATIDQIIDAAKQQALSPPQQPGQDQQAQMMAQQQAEQAQMQAQQQADAQKLMLEQQKIESKERVESAKIQAKAASEARAQDVKASIEAQKLELQRVIKEAELELKRITEDAKASRDQQAMAVKAAQNPLNYNG